MVTGNLAEAPISARGPVERGDKDIMNISDNDRILLAKLQKDPEWSIVNNPRMSTYEKAISTILNNYPNRYVEYINCGVQHRMIRRSELAEYGFTDSDVGKSFLQCQ